MLSSGKPYSWILLITMLALPFSNALAKKTKELDCQLQRYASIDLSINESGLILLPVTINGREALMALHLASSLGALKLDALENLGLSARRLGDGAVIKGGNETIRQYSRVPDFVMGGQARFGKKEFLVSKELRIEPAKSGSTPIVGYLGLTDFNNVDLELDVAAKKLNLYAPSTCPDRVVYWASEYAKVPMFKGKLGEMFFLMELDGKKLQTTLSTNDETTVLYTDASRKLYDFDETSPGIIREPASDAGKEATYYRAMALTNNNMKVLNAKIKLNSSSNCGVVRNRANGELGVGYDGCYGAYPLKLGLSILRKLHIYIATKEKAMYFTLNGADQAEASP